MIKFTDIPTYLGWKFTNLQLGTFKRDKADRSDRDFPILSPRPTHGALTRPMEECGKQGPYIYFVINGAGSICYIGKTHEKNPMYRWIRRKLNEPKGVSESYYWTHSTALGGTVFNIAEGLRHAEGPYTLRYAVYSDLLQMLGHRKEMQTEMSLLNSLKTMECILTKEFDPPWEGGTKKRITGRRQSKENSAQSIGVL